MAKEHVVIVGHGIAGSTAAFSLRDAGYGGEITLVGDEPVGAYYRTRLPEVVSGAIVPEKLAVVDPAKYVEKQIGVKTHVRVETVDANAATVGLSDGSRLSYSSLILATGAQSCIPPLPGARDLRGIFCLRTTQDAMAIRDIALRSKRAVCLGGGLLGLEAAWHLAKLGLAVEVAEGFPRLLPRQLDAQAAATLQRALEKQGLRFQLGIKGQRFVGEGQARGLEVAGAGVLEGDLFVISAGIAARTELAKQAGAACERGVTIDDGGRTSVAQIFAAGDLVQYKGKMWGTWLAARHWGKRVGEVVAGKGGAFSEPPESFRLKVSGIDLLTMGNADPDGRFGQSAGDAGWVAVLANRPEDCIYHKVVVEDSRVTGAMLLGPCQFTKLIENAVKTRQPWVEIAAQLGCEP